MSNLVDHARRELQLAGMYDTGDQYDEYNRMMAKAVMQLIEVFSEQGHSGFSASMVTAMTEKLLRFEPLTAITDDPEDWMEVSSFGGGKPLWQCRRQSSAFSNDGGKTYYLLEECRRGWRRKLFGMAPIHESEVRNG
jgi:hypothetical protein